MHSVRGVLLLRIMFLIPVRRWMHELEIMLLLCHEVIMLWSLLRMQLLLRLLWSLLHGNLGLVLLMMGIFLMLPSRIYHRQWWHHRLLFRDHRWILLLNVLRCLLRIRLVLQGMVLQMYYLRSVECCVHERSLLLSRYLQHLSLDFLMFRWIIILCYLELLLLLHLHWKCLRMLFRFRNLVMYALRSCMFHRKYFSLQLRDLLLL